MNGKTTIWLLLMTIALGAYIAIIDREQDSTSERRTAARLAFRFRPETIVSLRVDTPSGLFVLQRNQDQQWRMLNPVDAPADANAVLRLLDAFAAVRWSQVITPEEQRTLGLGPDRYGFTPPRAAVTFDDDAQAFTVFIGRDAPGRHHVYLKRSDRDDIYTASRDLLMLLPASAQDLRDRRLTALPPGRVRRIDIRAGNEVFQASRASEEHWQIERPVRARGAGNTIRQWLHRLYDFRVHEFIAESVAAGALYGLDQPRMSLSLSGDPGELPQTLLIGNPIDVDRTFYYATRPGQDSVFSVSAEVVEWLQAETVYFRDHRLLPFPANEIQSIQMNHGERSIRLTLNTQRVWEVVSPKRFTAASETVEQFLTVWTGTMIQGFIDDPSPAIGKYGLDQTNRVLRFGRSSATGAGNERETVIILGDTDTSGTLHATIDGAAFIITLPAALTNYFTVNSSIFRDPVILALDPPAIQRISQRSNGEERIVERTDAWFRPPDATKVPDTDAIDAIVRAAARLSVARFIEEDPRDLERYGLRNPLAQTTFGLSGAGGNRVLIFGTQASEDEIYAMRQGTDVVFTLPASVVKTLLKAVANPLGPPGARE